MSIKVDPAIILDYCAMVRPKIAQKSRLTPLDCAVKTAVEYALMGDAKGYKTAAELIGRMTAKAAK